MTKELIQEDGITFDSWEEVYFYWWAKELKEAGYVQEIFFHPKSFELSDTLSVPYVKPMKKVKDKVLQHKLLNDHIYTTDCMIIWNTKALGLLTFSLAQVNQMPHLKNEVELIPANEDGGTGTIYSFIEVKPIFDQNNMTRLAKINQKWVWEKYNRYVEIVIPEKLFKKTFTPERYLVTNKSFKARNLKYKPTTLKEFLSSENNSQMSLI